MHRLMLSGYMMYYMQVTIQLTKATCRTIPIFSAANSSSQRRSATRVFPHKESEIPCLLIGPGVVLAGPKFLRRLRTQARRTRQAGGAGEWAAEAVVVGGGGQVPRGIQLPDQGNSIEPRHFQMPENEPCSRPQSR